MLKTVTKFEHKVGDRVYHFLCDNDSPLGECHDALMAMKDFVMKRIVEVHESQKPKEEVKQDG